MKTRLRFPAGALLVAAGCLLAAARPAPAVATIPVSELRPGMKGVGRSVFTGRAVEEFGVEVIDVMHNVWPRGDLILCRLSGHGLEEAGVVEGMSGSPVYFGGRLAGAVAYGWSFSKEPIAGVTPIASMLEVWNSAPAAPGRGASVPLPGPERYQGFSPLPLPVAVSGLTPALTSLIGPALGGYGLVPVAAAGSAALPPDSIDLVPGAAVGIALIDGDVRVAAMGTLTARDGDRILAFGHPMFQAGATRLPLIAGVIHTVLPSVASSFKLFSPSSPIGTVYEDRLPGIAGRIGPVAPMVPVRLALFSPTHRDTYRFRVADVEELLPTLVATGAAEAVYQSEGTIEELSLAARTTVRFRAGSAAAAGHDSLVMEHRFSGSDPAGGLFKALRSELDALVGNRFTPVTVDAIDLRLDFLSGVHAARVVSARADRTRAHPGDTVGVALALEDYRGATTTQRLRLPIPRTVPDGTLQVLLASRDSLLAMEQSRAPGRLEPRSLAELLALMSETGRDDELVAAGFVRVPGVTVAGEELAAPPPSLKSALLEAGSDEALEATAAAPVFRLPLKFDRQVTGVARFEVEIVRNP